MAVRVIVNGAFGKMGILASATIENHTDFELCARLTKTDSLQTAIEVYRPDIVIDLTRADCAYTNTLTIIENHVHPVIGTSGLTDAEIIDLRQRSQEKKLGGIIAPNFSISAVLMMQFASIAARYLPDVSIIEAHHPQKFDAPSGTALKTAEMIAKARCQPALPDASRESIPGVCGGKYQDVSLHSIRLPGILAQQQVLFGNSGETLSIHHTSIDRACFMPGIILCCQKVLTIESLYYGMEQLIG
jgi:4-hydroxy-tetrahydrodipicolinate reductase